MKFKDLIADSQSIEKFNKLSFDLIDITPDTLGGIDPESIADLDEEEIEKAEKVYDAMALAIARLHEFLAS